MNAIKIHFVILLNVQIGYVQNLQSPARILAGVIKCLIAWLMIQIRNVQAPIVHSVTLLGAFSPFQLNN